MKKGLKFAKSQLEDLYLNKKLSIGEIGQKFGCDGANIFYWLKKFGIERRATNYNAVDITKKFKMPFNNSPEEKAFLLGLRAGDFHAKKIRNCVRVQTSTTHSAQVMLLSNSLSKYGTICKYLSKNKSRETEWFIYADIDKSFSFMLDKPDRIPDWILNKDTMLRIT